MLLHSTNRREFLRLLLGSGAALALTPRLRAALVRVVEASPKPGAPWTAYTVRTLEDFPNLSRQNIPLTPYGGLQPLRRKATGFFRTEKIGNRWWLIDPDGGRFINKGVASVRTTPTSAGSLALERKFGDTAKWATQTKQLLKTHGFNGVGAWSELETLDPATPKLATTRIWSFMSSFGKQLGLTFQQPGHTGYRGNAMPVFDPQFEGFADEYASRLAPYKNDPWLIGHFSDNELPLTRSALADFLQAPNEAGRQAAQAFLTERHGPSAGASDITDEDARAFLGKVVDRYFSVVGKAIRKHDPNHLVLGTRFHSEKTHDTLNCPEIFHACGPHLDVVSVNYYRAWTPDASKLAMWERESGRPVLITEWYAKAVDSGMPNNGGAGWLVHTQADRGLYYQHFALSLLESRVCVGWHWFKYSDNDPTDKKSDPSNRDSNKGVVTAAYEPYTPLLESMKAFNEHTYALIQHLDNTL